MAVDVFGNKDVAYWSSFYQLQFVTQSNVDERTATQEC
jgi:hypothetical protein